MLYRIRIDKVNDLNSDDILEVCDSEGHVIVFHELPRGNPHYHMYLDTQINDKALRQRFKRKFNLKASDYSVKKCDETRVNEYVQYMFNTKHGNRWELIATNNFDDKLLNDLIQAAKEVSDDFDATKKFKPKGPTIWDIAQEVDQIVNGQLTVNDLGSTELNERINRYSDESEEISVYTEATIKTLRKHRKAFDEFLIRKVISTAMSSTTRGKEILRRKMVKNFCQY